MPGDVFTWYTETGTGLLRCALVCGRTQDDAVLQHWCYDGSQTTLASSLTIANADFATVLYHADHDRMYVLDTEEGALRSAVWDGVSSLPTVWTTELDTGEIPELNEFKNWLIHSTWPTTDRKLRISEESIGTFRIDLTGSSPVVEQVVYEKKLAGYCPDGFKEGASSVLLSASRGGVTCSIRRADTGQVIGSASSATANPQGLFAVSTTEPLALGAYYRVEVSDGAKTVAMRYLQCVSSEGSPNPGLNSLDQLLPGTTLGVSGIDEFGALRLGDQEYSVAASVEGAVDVGNSFLALAVRSQSGTSPTTTVGGFVLLDPSNPVPIELVGGMIRNVPYSVPADPAWIGVVCLHQFYVTDGTDLAVSDIAGIVIRP